MSRSLSLPPVYGVVGIALVWGAAGLRGGEGLDGPHVARFVRGDVIQDGHVDLQDAILIVRYLYIAGAVEPRCLESADIDDDGQVRLNDVIRLLMYLWMAGPMPEAPFPACGEDTTLDGLGCAWGSCL